MTALSATASENATTALRAAANQEAVRTSTLNLGRLIGTFGSHDYSSIGINFSNTNVPSEAKNQLRRKGDCCSFGFQARDSENSLRIFTVQAL